MHTYVRIKDAQYISLPVGDWDYFLKILNRFGIKSWLKNKFWIFDHISNFRFFINLLFFLWLFECWIRAIVIISKLKYYHESILWKLQFHHTLWQMQFEDLPNAHAVRIRNVSADLIALKALILCVNTKNCFKNDLFALFIHFHVNLIFFVTLFTLWGGKHTGFPFSDR